MNEQVHTARWALAVFVARETPDVVMRALQAAREAAAGRDCIVDVLVNGNPLLARALQDQMGALHLTQARLWAIELGDKANAWNQYLHAIWSGEELSFFIDGYVRLQPDALTLLGDAVVRDPGALGGTGVPSVGRTAAALRADMLRWGGFHGNLCCIKGQTISCLRARDIRLPRGLYRTDSLLGGLLSFGLDPVTCNWNSARIHVHARATWQVDEKHWWSRSDWSAKLKRTMRQARGKLENEAAKQHLERDRSAPESLAPTARELVRQWRASHGPQARAFMLRHPLTYFALREMLHGEDTATVDIAPRLLWQTPLP